jgi:hypothetical protein
MDAGAPAPCAGQEPSTIYEMACSFRERGERPDSARGLFVERLWRTRA